MLRKFFLSLLIAGSTGAALLVLVLAARAGRLDSAVLFTLLPLVMLASLALKALRSEPRQ